MNIVTVCKEGNNRSVHFAHLLKYKYKCDVIAIGLVSHSFETQKMLFDWATHIILTDVELEYLMPAGYQDKLKVWDVGGDKYHRPFNPELHEIVKRFIAENPL